MLHVRRKHPKMVKKQKIGTGKVSVERESPIIAKHLYDSRTDRNEYIAQYQMFVLDATKEMTDIFGNFMEKASHGLFLRISIEQCFWNKSSALEGREGKTESIKNCGKLWSNSGETEIVEPRWMCKNASHYSIVLVLTGPVETITAVPQNARGLVVELAIYVLAFVYIVGENLTHMACESHRRIFRSHLFWTYAIKDTPRVSPKEQSFRASADSFGKKIKHNLEQNLLERLI